MGTLMSNGRKVLMVFSRDGRLCTKTYTSDGKLAWELEGDLLLKFAVDVAKGTTLFVIDNSTEVTANDDYKAGDYLYFSKGTFQPTRLSFGISIGTLAYEWYSEIRFLKGFDNSKWTNMLYAIGGWGYNGRPSCPLKIVDVSNFDTSKVTNIATMFCNCSSLTSLDVSNFDTKNVTSMSYMFYNCSSLTSLDVSNFDTSNVTNMSYMFYNCSSLTSLDVSNFDTKNVTSMSYMFAFCRNLTNLIFGSKWGTQTSTAANALTLDLSTIATSKSYKLTDETYNSMLTMYDRSSNGLATMTIKFSTKHNLPDGFAEKMSALGYTITLV